jgi:hypothetical protein
VFNRSDAAVEHPASPSGHANLVAELFRFREIWSPLSESVREVVMDALTERLTRAGNAVVVGGPNPSVDDLRKRVEEIGYVLLKFTETIGGTEVGIALDLDATDASTADFESGRGSVHLEGTLFLNGDEVRCVADVDVASLAGTGRLVPVAASPALAA